MNIEDIGISSEAVVYPDPDGIAALSSAMGEGFAISVMDLGPDIGSVYAIVDIESHNYFPVGHRKESESPEGWADNIVTIVIGHANMWESNPGGMAEEALVAGIQWPDKEVT